MRLEPRDTFYESGNKIFPELNGKIINQFYCFHDSKGEVIHVSFSVKNSKKDYQLYLDAGLAFWNESEAEQNLSTDPSLNFSEVKTLVNRKINEIFWKPDFLNSKIVIRLEELDATIACKEPNTFDSPSMFAIVPEEGKASS
jgi:hypothetical protein